MAFWTYKPTPPARTAGQRPASRDLQSQAVFHLQRMRGERTKGAQKKLRSCAELSCINLKGIATRAFQRADPAQLIRSSYIAGPLDHTLFFELGRGLNPLPRSPAISRLRQSPAGALDLALTILVVGPV